MCALLKSNVKFVWEKPQRKAFNKITQILSVALVFTYFDVIKLVTITCDGSKTGLGTLLLQDNKPIAYASRALTDPNTDRKKLTCCSFWFYKISLICVWKGG